MRVFAALPLPPTAVEAISRTIASLRLRFPSLRYVSSKGMHLTLHFFGELPDEAVAGLRALFKDPELSRPAIEASFAAIGGFPQRGAPRVIHVGIAKGGEELAEYWRLFHSKIVPLSRLGGEEANWRPEERGFSPHITLARAGRERLAGNSLDGTEGPSMEFTFSELVLFRSILKPHGSEYIPLEVIHFNGAAR